MNKLSSQIIIDIIQHEMNIEKNHIWLRNQNKKIPDDDDLSIIVGIVDSHVYSNITEISPITVNSVDLMQELQRLTVLENVQIDVVSRSIQAAKRSWEVIAAIHSLYAQQQQEVNNFKIFRVAPSWHDISTQEGGSFVNRYSIIIPVHAWYQKTKVLSQNGENYYDDFTTRVDDDKSIGTAEGIIEFEINSTGVH